MQTLFGYGWANHNFVKNKHPVPIAIIYEVSCERASVLLEILVALCIAIG